MKVLVVANNGGAGREHALCWKIAQSKRVDKIFCNYPNPGRDKVAQPMEMDSTSIFGIASRAKSEGMDLTFVGPEAPLMDGIVDEFNKNGLRIFGPTADAAMLEGSKAFAKEIMLAAGVPTARYEVFGSIDDANAIAKRFGKAAVKADGLAGGKGVILCNSPEEIVQAIKTLGNNPAFPKSANKIVVEELLEGEEATMLAFCDGKTAKLMPSSQDHKRIFDGNKGSNTGGMGAYAPALVTLGLEQQVLDRVFMPVLREMARRGMPYKGVLYAGLMIKGKEFKVLEFNARFGDPEAQAVLSLLDTDLVDIADACIDGRLDAMEIKWKIGAACCVVMASKGYPDSYEKGKVIQGIEEANMLKKVQVFQAGTKLDNGNIVTNGGRVLGVTGTGDSIKEAIENAYLGVSKITFEGMQYRTDIGKSALMMG